MSPVVVGLGIFGIEVNGLGVIGNGLVVNGGVAVFNPLVETCYCQGVSTHASHQGYHEKYQPIPR